MPRLRPHRNHTLAAALIVCLAALPSNGRSDEPETAEPGESVPRDVATDGTTDDPVERSTDDLLDSLLKRDDAKPPKSPSKDGQDGKDDQPTKDDSKDAKQEDALPGLDVTNPLTDAADRMDEAGRRLGDLRDPGQATRALQERAVADLEALIELAKRQQQQQRNSSNGPSPTPNKPKGQPGEDEPMPGGDPMAAGEEPKPGDEMPDGDPMTGNERRKEDEASESSDATAAARRRAAAEAERRRLVKDVWGHLPPAMRDELMNAYRDRALTKYEDLVRAYFRALAEKADRRED